MGMFDALHDADGHEWQTKALDRLLATYQIGDPIPGPALTYQLEVLGTGLDRRDAYATIHNGTLTTVPTDRDPNLPLRTYGGTWQPDPVPSPDWTPTDEQVRAAFLTGTHPHPHPGGAYHTQGMLRTAFNRWLTRHDEDQQGPITLEALQDDWDDHPDLTDDDIQYLRALPEDTQREALDNAFKSHEDTWYTILDSARNDATRALLRDRPTEPQA